MRREGFELAVSQPRILMKRDEEGKLLEPVEEVSLVLRYISEYFFDFAEVAIEVDNENSGWVIEKLTQRLGRLESMIQEEEKVKIA